MGERKLPASSSKHRPDIDGLRAVAVICVVVFHAFPQFMPGGFVGVDVFFVISGYLISGLIVEQLAERRFSFAEFYIRRVRRIFPALLLVLITTCGLGYALLLPQERQELFKHMAAGAGFVSNFVLWGEAGYFDGAAETKPLLHLWSLAIEEQFYLAWPVVLWSAWRFRQYLWAVLLMLIAASLVLNLAGIQRDAVATFYSPQTRFWELLCGAALAWAKFRSGTGALQPRYLQVLRNGLSLAGLLLLGLAVWWLDAHDSYPGVWAALPVIASIALLGVGGDAWGNRVLLSSRAMVWVGLLSYPLYLWHWPLLSLARTVAGATPSVDVRIAAILAALVLASLTHRLLETPLRYGSHGSRKAVALSALMLALGFISLVAYRFDSVPDDQRSRSANASQLGWQVPPASGAQIAYCRKRFPDRQVLSPTQRDDNFCLLARDAAADVLLVGDSMALSLFPGLSRHTDFNTLVLSASSAAPLYDIRTTEFGDAIRIHNYKLTNQALDYALRNDQIKVVVMGFVGGPALATAHSGYVITDIANPGAKGAEYIFKTALVRTLRQLVAGDKHVIYVLPNPALSYDIRNCVALPRPFEPERQRICDQPADRHLVRGGWAYRTWVETVVRDFPQVTVFDAAEPLCDGVRCWGFKDGELFYRDSLHLSMAGSKLVAASLAPVIQAALRRQQP